MRRTRMTSMLAIGGLVVAGLQWFRMRSRPRTFNGMTHRLGQMFQRTTGGTTNRMMNMVRRRVR